MPSLGGSCVGFGVFGSWRKHCNSPETTSFKLYVYTWAYIYYRVGFFDKMLIVWFLVTFSNILIVILPLSPFSVYISLPFPNQSLFFFLLVPAVHFSISPPTQWFCFTSVVSAVTPRCIFTSEDLELRVSSEAALIFLCMSHLSVFSRFTHLSTKSMVSFILPVKQYYSMGLIPCFHYSLVI